MTTDSEERSPDIDQLIEELEELHQTVDQPEEREQVEETLELAERIPGGQAIEQRISKYTTRDLAETFVGGIIFSLPLLVEDGVFEIAEHFVNFRVGGIPIFFIANILFVVMVTVGLLYWADIREVKISRPIFGIIPRRLTGVLIVSFTVAAGLMLLWGRTFEEDPSNLEVIARVTVIWAAAAFGGSLGDILPGESRGHDITVENLDEIIKPD